MAIIADDRCEKCFDAVCADPGKYLMSGSAWFYAFDNRSHWARSYTESAACGRLVP